MTEKLVYLDSPRFIVEADTSPPSRLGVHRAPEYSGPGFGGVFFSWPSDYPEEARRAVLTDSSLDSPARLGAPLSQIV